MTNNHIPYNQRWIEINADALSQNVKILKSAVAPAKLMAVVKANAYGHGAKLVAPILRDAGADAFGVTTIDEARELIDAGLDSIITPILCFAPISDLATWEWAIQKNLHLTVADLSALELAQSAEKATGLTGNVHLKVDTGMGRLGLSPEQGSEIAIKRNRWAGVYTHFPNASAQSSKLTLQPLKKFTKFIEFSRKKRIEIIDAHCANTAAALRFPETRLDMVRIGTALYGQMPSEYVPKPNGLRSDTFALKARILQVKELNKGDTIGYCSEFTAKMKTRVAVIPIGFADGFGVAPTSLYSGLRGLSRVLKSNQNSLSVTINGQPAPVLGRVAMQMIVVDISKITGSIQAGDIVDVPIRRLAASALIERVLVRD
jgi:alanine racemase